MYNFKISCEKCDKNKALSVRIKIQVIDEVYLKIRCSNGHEEIAQLKPIVEDW